MMGVMDVLCSAIHIVESQKMVVGWVYTMMDAITKDVKKWSEKPLTITLWKEESLKACIAAVNKRWGGEASRCVSARTDVHVFAHVVNPLFFPISKELSEPDRECCERVLRAYYKDEPEKADEAIDQFDGILLRQERFGRKVQQIQDAKEKKLRDHGGFDSETERV